MFRSPSHRPNLRYELVPKSSSASAVLDDIASFILNKHPTGAGLVYCFSKKDSRTVAQGLRERGVVSSQTYNADLSIEDREAILRAWSKGRLQVVVATTAFGLGINKPDCRFVVHHSLSKSVESLYQEAGRAGRDGLPSDCRTYYSATDVMRQSTMVCFEHAGVTNLYKLVRLCENMKTCRRVLLGSHFGDDDFDPKDCKGSCDTCASAAQLVLEDVTEHAAVLVQIVSVRNTIPPFFIQLSRSLKGPLMGVPPPCCSFRKKGGGRVPWRHTLQWFSLLGSAASHRIEFTLTTVRFAFWRVTLFTYVGVPKEG